MKDLIQVLAQSIVVKPENVAVSELLGNHCTVVALKVHKSEIGRVVGKHGRTAKALQTIVDAVSSKLRKRTVLEILEADHLSCIDAQQKSAHGRNPVAPVLPSVGQIRKRAGI